jgi:hypothetical protein
VLPNKATAVPTSYDTVPITGFVTEIFVLTAANTPSASPGVGVVGVGVIVSFLQLIINVLNDMITSSDVLKMLFLFIVFIF